MKTNTLLIWDLPTRLFHWSLVSAIAFLWYSGETGELMDIHMMVGVAVLSLIVYRVIWGFFGSDTARFTNFISISGAFAHFKELRQRHMEPEAGHNPLGGLMVIALLIVVLLQALSGLFITDDILTDGPLYSAVSSDIADLMGRIHHLNFTVLQVLVASHIAAIGFYLLYKKTNLVRPMIVGRMNWPTELSKPQLRVRSSILAAVLFLVVYLLVRLSIAYFA